MYLYQILQRNQLFANKIISVNSDMSFAGIVSGNNVGEVWANDLYNPDFCLVWSEHLECFQFMGSRFNHINKLDLQVFIRNTISKFLNDKEINFFEFACDSHEWLIYISSALDNHEIKKSKQYVYKLNGENTINTDLITPAGYDIFEVNEHFIKFKEIENCEILYSEIEKSWGTTDKFLDYAKCFVAVQSNKICSFALTTSLYKDIYSIYIETFDPHKQKGLSSFLSMTLINSIINQNATVWWDCMESNIASQKTAQKVGLVFNHEYEVCWFDL